MEENFSTTFLKLLLSDISKILTDFPLLIISFVLLLVVVTLIFKRKEGETYDEYLKSETEKSLKKTLAQLEKETLFDVLEIDMSRMLGVDAYVYYGIDVLFTCITGKNKEQKYLDQEKVIYQYLEKNNESLTLSYKRNIVNLYFMLKENKPVKTSNFHIYFFAKYFPQFLDLSLKGEYIIDVDNFTKDDIVDSLENPSDKFSFSEFFLMVVRRVDAHQLEMSKYMKIKQIFSSQIEFRYDGTIARKKVPHVPPEETIKTKEKIIVYSIVPKENRVKKRALEMAQNISKKEADAKKVELEADKKRKEDEFVPNIIFEDGKHISIQLKAKKIANQDINNQNKVVEEILKEEEVVVEKPAAVIEQSKAIESILLNSILLESQDEKKEEEKEEENFGFAKIQTSKKEFNPMSNIRTLFNSFSQDNIHSSVQLVFKENGNIYVSIEYLFLKISTLYSLKNYDKFDDAFVTYIRDALKIANFGKPLQYIKKTILLKNKNKSKNKKADVLFLIFKENFMQSKMQRDFINGLEEFKTDDLSDLEDLDIFEYLKRRNCCEQKIS